MRTVRIWHISWLLVLVHSLTLEHSIWLFLWFRLTRSQHQALQGKYFPAFTGQKRADWIPQWNWASMVGSQAGLQNTFWYHGYWYEPRREWFVQIKFLFQTFPYILMTVSRFFNRRKLDIKVDPFNLEQLGASGVLLVFGLLLAIVAFINEFLPEANRFLNFLKKPEMQ